MKKIRYVIGLNELELMTLKSSLRAVLDNKRDMLINFEIMGFSQTRLSKDILDLENLLDRLSESE